jgi:hypothetical protein
MAVALLLLQILVLVVMFGCFLMVVLRMFQEDKTVLGIVSIVLTVCTLIGWLLPFVYGWIKVQEWRMMPIMGTWTACLVLEIILGGASLALKQ